MAIAVAVSVSSASACVLFVACLNVVMLNWMTISPVTNERLCLTSGNTLGNRLQSHLGRIRFNAVCSFCRSTAAIRTSPSWPLDQQILHRRFRSELERLASGSTTPQWPTLKPATASTVQLLFWLQRKACFLPRVEASEEWVNVLPTMFHQYLRHTGA